MVFSELSGARSLLKGVCTFTRGWSSDKAWSDAAFKHQKTSLSYPMEPSHLPSVLSTFSATLQHCLIPKNKHSSSQKAPTRLYKRAQQQDKTRALSLCFPPIPSTLTSEQIPEMQAGRSTARPCASEGIAIPTRSNCKQE